MLMGIIGKLFSENEIGKVIADVLSNYYYYDNFIQSTPISLFL